jgi:glutaconate CoA-transferase subunit B
VVTTLGVFRFDPATCEMYLASYHPGQSVESVRAATGFSLATAPDVGPTPTPTAGELAVVRACDPAGFWTR